MIYVHPWKSYTSQMCVIYIEDSPEVYMYTPILIVHALLRSKIYDLVARQASKLMAQ